MKNLFVNPFDKKQNKDPMAPSYIKPDGTQVIEQKQENGMIVYEKCPDGALLFRSYNNNGKMIMDFARDKNFEVKNK